MLPRRLVRGIILAATVSVLALAAVPIVSAAPPDVTTYRACYPDGEQGTDTICFTIHDVQKDQSTKSGNAHSKEVGSMLIEYFDADGNLLWSDSTRWHLNVLEKNGEVHVYHDQNRFKYTEVGVETCTNSSFAQFVNGAIRHLGPEWEWVCN